MVIFLFVDYAMETKRFWRGEWCICMPLTLHLGGEKRKNSSDSTRRHKNKHS